MTAGGHSRHAGPDPRNWTDDGRVDQPLMSAIEFYDTVADEPWNVFGFAESYAAYVLEHSRSVTHAAQG